MAEKIKSDDEPSIEEILDSIRQIISEDDKQAAKTAPEPAVAPAVNEKAAPVDEFDALFDSLEQESNAAEEDDDVFELTERIEPDVVFEEPEPAPPPPPPPVDKPVAKVEEPPFVVDLIDESSEDEQEQRPESSVKSDQFAPKSPEMAEESILTQAAESAAFEAIAALARRTAVEHNGITIEEIVRSELKPLLRGWWDKNLPVVIERLVREELERVSKRVLED